jgi:hypothetical protein
VSIQARPSQYVIGRGDVTLVLERCPCGKTRTRNINGHWSLDQLAGK